ncbi:hypothetical protein EW146_g6880 [Bondarzewia mesenterica]|uniref:Uncharacterized protein n=1 Tax=Bondarzewia mesenterica TaxID=1095465 RepID=A0A4S4LP94_9AGAM|nr:hypothetical protein EW146_g6880 [Bondarzewia mesenterica]
MLIPLSANCSRPLPRAFVPARSFPSNTQQHSHHNALHLASQATPWFCAAGCFSNYHGNTSVMRDTCHVIGLRRPMSYCAGAPTETRYRSPARQTLAIRFIYGMHLHPDRSFSHLASLATSKEPNHASSSTNETSDPLHIPAHNLSPAQLSRAGATAIRVSLQHKAPWDAFHLLHSMRWSYNKYQHDASHHPASKFRNPGKSFVPIDFGQPVSPRLAAHCLIHGLLRAGLQKPAAKLAEQMMDDGVGFRTKTFEALLRALHPNTLVPGEDRTLYNRVKHFFPRTYQPQGREVLAIRNVMPADPLTRYAVRLLRDARKHRWQRTQSMYETVVHACLVQGEILVASLLLALLIKDYQLQRACARMAQKTGAEQPESSLRAEDRPLIPQRGFRHLSGLHPKQPFQQILEFLSQNISKGPDDALFAESSQSLAILASALDTRQLPMYQLSFLIRLLYSYPRNNTQVWATQRNGQARQLNAYSYFHSVLVRLALSLPSGTPWGIVLYPKTWLRPLDIESYNALIHYALRHRYSMDLAQKVINHMTDVRQPPLSPNTITYSILLRSSTLLRRNDMAEQVLQKVRSSVSPAKLGLTAQEAQAATETTAQGIQAAADNRAQEAQAVAESKVEGDAPENEVVGLVAPPWRSLQISALIGKLQKHRFDVPDSSKPLRMDVSLLTSYITHLVSIDKCDAVADVLFQVLPELAAVDHPDWGTSSVEYRKLLMQLNREKCVQRAMRYGPYFFTSVLNALSKAGRTGLAERVWLLAKKAEAASWKAASRGDSSAPSAQRPKPWALPVHAYTTMVQCYANEARKGLMMKRARRREEDSDVRWDVEWIPASINKVHVIGWARYFLQRLTQQEAPNWRRSVNGQKMGILLYRSMRGGAQSVYRSLLDLQSNRVQPPDNVELPVPDERFFNATLDLFGRRPGIFVRKTHPTRSHWRQRLRRARTRYVRQDVMSPHWTPVLEEVARDMNTTGLTVPAGFREVLIGRWQDISTTLSSDEESSTMRKTSLLRPYAFPRIPKRPRFRPHAAPTVKTRGLPIGGR